MNRPSSKRSLFDEAKKTPKNPGVYLFKDASGRVLYVGKSRNIRSRMSSYISGDDSRGPGIERMISEARHVDYVVTNNEKEALILEHNLIREYRPRYNVRLKDDKRYPYLKITTNEKYPRITVVRQLKQDGAKYFGPYTDVKAMRKTLRLLVKLFPIRTCRVLSNRKRPCLDFFIGRCLGPCCDFDDDEAYHQVIREASMFLEGKAESVLKGLKRRMQKAAESKDFERAAYLRDRIGDIETVVERQSVVSSKRVDRDVLAVAREGRRACGVVVEIREGKLLRTERVRISSRADTPDFEVLLGFIEQYYLMARSIPSEVVVAGEIREPEELESRLSDLKNSRVKVTTPKRGKKRELATIAIRNAQVALGETLELGKGLRELRERLSLTKTPRRIEAVDISLSAGKEPVGSVVVFANGSPKKSDYRKYRIKTVTGTDDFAMVSEVVSRRFKKLIEQDSGLPDLLLVDGGKGQLSAAQKALESLGILDVPIVALAKKEEEIFLPGRKESIRLPKSAPELRLLMQIRNEAHRFAIAFHRSVRSKKTLSSRLDEIPGVGEKRKRLLLDYFGSVERLKKATVDDIAGIEGIGPSTARLISENLADERGGQ
jgi:excinuclease ABC subunit C